MGLDHKFIFENGSVCCQHVKRNLQGKSNAFEDVNKNLLLTNNISNLKIIPKNLSKTCYLIYNNLFN